MFAILVKGINPDAPASDLFTNPKAAGCLALVILGTMVLIIGMIRRGR